MSTSVAGLRIPPCVVLHSEVRPRVRVRAARIGGGSCGIVINSAALLPSFRGDREKNGGALTDTAIAINGEKEKNVLLLNGGIGEKEIMSSTEGLIRSKVEVTKKAKKIDILAELGLLWDDGYGTKTVKDFLDGAKEMIRLDDGPLRWFSPEECGQPLKDSPILLFLPGIDGVGLGLTLHHQALGKVFEVRCLHIPVHDRTPFAGLLEFVEETVRSEHASSPNKPIYLVGESFGACLALAVAARNPNIDLVLILANPATSFNRSQLQTLLPILEALPDGFHDAVPYFLSLAMGNPVKMASTDIDRRLPPGLQAEQLSQNLTALLDYPFVLADLIPNDGLLWKLKLLKSAASYVNARLHAVKAEVLVIASGNDYLFPSENEAQRLNNSLQNCLVRNFRDHGHSILLEGGVNLLTIIKGTKKYRRSRRLDHVADYIPPSMSEYRYIFEEYVGWFLAATGSAFYSTLEDGRIVKGIEGVPNEGPVLLVGYHMLLGCEIYSIVEEFLRQKNVLLRGISHPDIFSGTFEELAGHEFTVGDWIKLMGAVPVSGSNFFKLFSRKSYILLYPGGQREALHYKGEEYKLFWPDQPEFVRMAARFGATIVPFGTVGEDDIAEMVLDYHDIMKIPILNDFLREIGNQSTRVRDESKGEVANQDLTTPVFLPKVPGRFYFLFGKPIRTEGMEEMLKDKENVNELYSQIKTEVANNIEYLLKKREEDPYRNIIDRTLYRMLYSSLDEVPAFDP